MILVIDNYDSFVYNLVQLLRAEQEEVVVFRPDEMSLHWIKSKRLKAIVISPGPGNPNEQPLNLKIVKCFLGKIPMLGVCLGHQTIAAAVGAEVVRNERIMHGKCSEVFHDGRTIFSGLKNPFLAVRYHSLLVSEKNMPSVLEVSACTAEGEIMGVRVRGALCEGVQFHPESFLCTEGEKLLRNFLDLTEGKCIAS